MQEEEQIPKARSQASTREWQLFKEIMVAMAHRGALDQTAVKSDEQVAQLCQHVGGVVSHAMKVVVDRRF